ncbi:MAG: PDZ domain-containing protein [Lentisphaeria bacterium]|nr:PDZ domain-containing protein [Lentisphaeria bacterium]
MKQVWTHGTRVRVLVAVVTAAGLASALVSPAAAADEDLQVAERLEAAFTKVAERAKPAVVVITNKQVAPRQPFQQMPPELWRYFGFPFEPPRQPDGDPREPGPRSKPRPETAGKGSGVIIREDGYIVTNYHVIEGNDALEVKLDDGRVFDSERDPKGLTVVGVDKETDLAVLRIGGGSVTGLPTLPFADSDALRVGAWAIAIGAPFNLDYSVTVGHVSQKGRYDVGMTTFENYIQTDASINPGNSGGPLLNIRGEVIGINEFIVTGGGMNRGSIGLGFAIASNLVRQVAEDLIQHGEVMRPFLGISMQLLDDTLKQQFGVEAGVLVSEVLPGDPAEKAGVKPGDVVTHVGEKEVRTPHDLLFAVLSYDPGDKIRLQIMRKGKPVSVEVVARRRSGDDTAGTPIRGRQDMLDKLGITVEETDEGVFVGAVVGSSPADRADLRRGDRILEVNQTETQRTEDVIGALKKTRNNVAVFYIDRRGSKRYVGVELEPGKEEKE